MRNSFVFYNSWWEAVKDQPKEIREEVLAAIIEYCITGKEPEMRNSLSKMAFSFIKRGIGIPPIKLPITGENHWNWKGGISDENHRVRESAKYKQWRKDVFIRDGYTCQHCGAVGGMLNAHHIKPFSVFPELRFDVSNGITLCKQCHIELHRREREWEKKHS